MKQGDVSKARRNAARELGSRLVHDPRFRTSMPLQESGERHFMVVAANERMATLFRRVSKVGLPLTVAVRHRGTLNTISVRPVESQDSGRTTPVHPNITMGMMVDVLWEEGGGSLLVHLGSKEQTNPARDGVEHPGTDYEVVGL